MSCEQPDFSIHRGDLLPVLQAIAKTCSGPVDFTGWTLTFSMSGPREVSGPATGTSAGVLEYTWASGDTTVAGFYEGRFIGTSPSGKQQTFPTKGHLLIEVTE